MIDRTVDETSGFNDVDIRFLIKILWSRRILIAIFIAIFFISSLAYAYWLPNIYRADVTLAPKNSNESSGASLTSKFGGLASLAGVSLGSSGIDKPTLGLEILKSRKFLTEFIAKYRLASYIVAVESWNEFEEKYTFNSEIYDADTGHLKRIISNEKLYKKFMAMLSISKNKENGIVKITFEYYSPELAAKILENLVDELNEAFKIQEINQARESIEYLKKELEANHINELKLGLYELIQNQTEKIMLANASPEYLFQVIDPAMIPEAKIKPNRILVVFSITILGLIIGSIFAIVLGMKRTHQKQKMRQ